MLTAFFWPFIDGTRASAEPVSCGYEDTPLNFGVSVIPGFLTMRGRDATSGVAEGQLYTSHQCGLGAVFAHSIETVKCNCKFKDQKPLGKKTFSLNWLLLFGNQESLYNNYFFGVFGNSEVHVQPSHHTQDCYCLLLL